MSLPPSGQGSIAGGVAFPLPVRQSHPLEAPSLAWRAEVVREVGIDYVRVTSVQPLFHLDHRLLGISLRTVGVLLGWKIGFEDRFEHQKCCAHTHPIAQGRDAQRSKLAIGLRDKHSSNGIRSVALLSERQRQ